MMGLLPIEPFFPEERTGVGEKEKETVDSPRDFEPTTTKPSLPGVFSDKRSKKPSEPMFGSPPTLPSQISGGRDSAAKTASSAGLFRAIQERINGRVFPNSPPIREPSPTPFPEPPRRPTPFPQHTIGGGFGIEEQPLPGGLGGTIDFPRDFKERPDLRNTARPNFKPRESSSQRPSFQSFPSLQPTRASSQANNRPFSGPRTFQESRNVASGNRFGGRPSIRVGDEIVTFRPLTNQGSDVRLPPVTPAVINASEEKKGGKGGSRRGFDSRGTARAPEVNEFVGETDFQRPPLRESPKSAEGNPFPNFQIKTPSENNFGEIPRSSDRRISSDSDSDFPQGEERQRLLEAALAAEAREKEKREEEMRKLKEAGAARRAKLFDKERRRLSGINNRRRKLGRGRNREDERKEEARERKQPEQPEPEVIKSQRRVVEEATKAVQRKEKTGNVRSSPIVWAAVMTLSEFLASQERSTEAVPTDVLEAIRRLTLFIREEEPVREEEELKSMQAITQFTRRRQQEENTERQQTTRLATRPTSRPTTRSTTRFTTRSTTTPTTRPFRRPTTRQSFRFTESPSTTRQTTTRSTSIPRRGPFLPTRKSAQEKFTRPPPPSYLTDKPPIADETREKENRRKEEEEERNFFAQKYLESDLIRQSGQEEEKEEVDYSDYPEYPDYPDYSPPSVKFKFKFNTETGVFSANTDLQLKIADAQGKSSKPPAPVQNNRFQIYTLPT